ncbi:class I SAM-dependent methyltransferase [Bacillus sp. FJAT-28004]|uniref:class I SAM-dependent methyltransferase n=1 Tax=Bacillus sp. FJAT-28004 TaxID=1679165 RepID=UPI0013793515|nr:methyltransferase domain-containing protein [Bacillus sp. FJAT-28004]
MKKPNPFLNLACPQPLGPGSFEMASSLVEATNIQAGMRVLEVGAGTGQIAATLAKYWDVTVVTLEPWGDLNTIHENAEELGVSNRVLALNVVAQRLPFADNCFDAEISIGSFEMIKDERPEALKELIRVSKEGARIGIAEPMCLHEELPADLITIDYFCDSKEYFRTVEWNANLFRQYGLNITSQYYFDDGYKWWVDNFRYYDGNKEEILQDGGRWLSLGLVVREKQNS